MGTWVEGFLLEAQNTLSMCGIAGFIDLTSQMDPSSIMESMLLALEHRGPDGRGMEIVPNPSGTHQIALGHQRLSIIDLTSGGHQPMPTQDRLTWLTTNSEIYNYRELRSQLGQKHSFRGKSDTEVLLHAYAEWGIECLNHIKGIYAFGLWDGPRETLYLARDRMGVKPLYFSSQPDYFTFASEVRALLAPHLKKPTINPAGLFQYMTFGRLAAPNTLIEGIQEIPPGHYLRFSLREKLVEKVRYWNLLPPNGYDHFSHLTLEKIRSNLLNSIDLRMVSDVPVGSFLSGGIDSSAVTQLAVDRSSQRLDTVSMGFSEKKYDETPYSSLLAEKLETRHKSLLVQEADFLKGIEGALHAMDQPTVDGINTYFISRCAREQGLKVILSGLGGDELFGGYRSFTLLPKIMRWEKLLRPLPPWFRRSIAGTLKHFLPESDPSQKFLSLLNNSWPNTNSYFLFRSLFSGIQLMELFSDQEIAEEQLRHFLGEVKTLQESLQAWKTPEQISYLELTQYMIPMLLRDTDMMSMAHGLEVRVPLIDPELVHTLLSIPGHYKRDPEIPKPLLVKSVKPPLPDSIVKRKKMGFTLPLEKWMRGELKREIETTFLTPSPVTDSWVSSQATMKVWDRFLNRKTSWSRPWSLYVLKKWIMRNVEGRSGS